MEKTFGDEKHDDNNGCAPTKAAMIEKEAMKHNALQHGRSKRWQV